MISAEVRSRLKYYKYKALTEHGSVVTGTAGTSLGEELSEVLKARGLTLIFCQRTWLNCASGRSRWTRRDMIHFVFHLEQMLSAGISIVDTIDEFAQSVEKKSLRLVANELLQNINGGKSFSSSCACIPEIFPPMIVSMLEAGEQSGRLDAVLREMGELLKWQDESLTRLRRVLIYPAFVAAVLFIVVVFIMTWLVPGMVSFITAAGATLPWHTRALITTSDMVTQYWMAVVIFGLVALTSLRLGVSTNAQLRLFIDGVILKTPLVGSVLLKTRLARFSRCAALMYGAGVNIVQALLYARRTLDNTLLESEVEKVGQRLIDGNGVASSFGRAQGFPPLMARILKVGESTGALDVSFNQLGYVYDRESRELTERLEQSLGPVMTVSVGLVMMWVVISVIGPIYDLVFSMNSGAF